MFFFNFWQHAKHVSTCTAVVIAMARTIRILHVKFAERISGGVMLTELESIESKCHYRVYKKVYSWKILAKLTRLARTFSYSNKLTPSGTSSTEIIPNYIVLWVANVLLKVTLKTACAQKWVTKHDVWINWAKIWSMLYKLSKAKRERDKRKSSKKWIFRCFPNPKISLRGCKLILCMLGFMH